jgi:hypothetical protein
MDNEARSSPSQLHNNGTMHADAMPQAARLVVVA